MAQKHFGRLKAKIIVSKPIVAQVARQGISRAGARVSAFQKEIDDFFKITDVKEAQSTVTDSEKKFLEARNLARQSKKELEQSEQLLQEARKKVDRCPRDDSEKYLACVSEERAVWVKVQDIKKANQEFEHAERELFTEYSNAVRISHEKERERAQKTRYWSIIGSIAGTVVGFFGSSMLTFYRLNKIKQIASPDAIVNDLRSEIMQRNMEQAEIQKSFQVNTLSLINGLEQKIEAAGNKDQVAQLTPLDYSVSKSTEELIENSKTEIKDYIVNANKELSQFKENFSVDLQSTLRESVDQLSKKTVFLLNQSFDEQNAKLTEKISTVLSNASGNSVVEIHKYFKMEMKKLSDHLQLMSEQMSNANRELSIKENSTPLQEEVFQVRGADGEWKINVNLAVSVLSFSLLLFVVLKN